MPRRRSCVTNDCARAVGNEHGETVRHLHGGKINLRLQILRVGSQAPLIHVVYDADDLGGSIAHSLVFCYANAFADGIVAAKIFSGEGFIDHGHRGGVFVVLRSKEAAAAQTNLHHLQIIGIDDVFHGPVHLVLAGGFCVAVEPEDVFIVAGHGERGPRHRDGLHARRGGDSAIEFARESAHGFSV